MPEWVILLLVAWVIFRVMRREGCGTHRHRLDDAERSRLREQRARMHAERARLRAERRGRKAVQQRAARAETPVESLQRRFVDGSITVDQYERELDRIYRNPSSAA